ncbi:NADH-quinone oxidoreductase subunit L [Rubritalea profundi]|uniref:NADH-quinone oxidoreductase subunit L n=1 Tax=Rubritalea profundi TaxID=1658618 RepID=A0A2S7U079_9BACT|nr:NADH-quinone oxidoreductase subunit L [Rubritalea profundi]PQJ28408.1 NADH-quinone oxidoreductase subunit L [Rubritalea profundi]
MLNQLWLVPTLPLLGFLILALCGSRWSRGLVATVGCGSIGLSALVATAAGFDLLTTNSENASFTQHLWNWFEVGGLSLSIGLHLDALSLLMILVVTWVAFFIHIYASEYMAKEGYSRFFAYLNLFVCAMLVLVLADNLLMLLLGWEGVGLCSYLLIGFWYSDPANGAAARKAFVVTRVGDTALMVGILLLFKHLGTLDIGQILSTANAQWQPGSTIAITAAALLLGGAVGKSSQLPLQTWLPDAMAGPTPVSALVHAATMVTAGVYLIARMHGIFLLAPVVMGVVAVLGATTMLVAGCSALVQSDLKRVLAYSTISQIGYMFLALGVGAWTAAMFHFMTHAFFKALLFLGAGAVIHSLNDQKDMFKMGGLRKKLPAVFWTFLIGSASLAALPLVTSGFYSKELILWSAWASPHGHPTLWAAGIVGAFITALYTTRAVILTFFGKVKTEVSHQPGARMVLPLCILAALSTVAGLLQTPHSLGHLHAFSDLLETALPVTHLNGSSSVEITLQAVAVAIVLAGVALAYWLYQKAPHLPERIASGWGKPIRKAWLAGWGFDWIYDQLLVKPIVAVAQLNRRDIIDLFYTGLASFARLLNFLLSASQTGRMRWYAAGISAGTIFIFLIVYFT